MKIVKLGPADYRTMPWKNGAGSTTELLIEPPGATLAGGFRWRVSMATVAESGPFSRFPGIDRTLLLLEGQGLELDHGPHGRALLPGPLVPVRFPGEWTTSGRLLGGPCRDFNVMSRRDALLHEVVMLHVGVPAALPEAPVVLAYCCRGSAQVSTGVELGAGELLRIDGQGSSGLMIRAASGSADLAVVAFRPRTEPG
jgi:environmental stress-induced protein Ves